MLIFKYQLNWDVDLLLSFRFSLRRSYYDVGVNPSIEIQERTGLG